MTLKTSNKYSDKKIVWFWEKLNSFRDNVITAPIYVRIKPLNACNHHCFWCVYHSDLTMMHGQMNAKDMLPKDKFREVLDDLKDIGTKAITYSGGGEPLLYPGIEEFLQKTLDNGLNLSIITHGQFLEKKKADILAKSSWVRVSMDYYDGESIKQSRGVRQDTFNKIIDNINNFSSIKDSLCDLSVNYIITKQNYQNLYKITEILKNNGVDNIRFSPMWIDTFHDYHAEFKEDVFSVLEDIKNKYNCESFKVYSSYGQVNDLNVSKRLYKKCFVNQTIPVIGADQNIYTCHNQAYSDDSIVGSIKEKSFKEVWFNEEVKKFFDEFNCQKTCTGQCAADSKNKFITELIDCYGDNYV